MLYILGIYVCIYEQKVPVIAYELQLLRHSWLLATQATNFTGGINEFRTVNSTKVQLVILFLFHFFFNFLIFAFYIFLLHFSRLSSLFSSFIFSITPYRDARVVCDLIFSYALFTMTSILLAIVDMCAIAIVATY